MPPTSTLDLHNKALNGRLIPLLRKHPATGKSYETLAHELRNKGVNVSSATVRRWVKQVAA